MNLSELKSCLRTLSPKTTTDNLSDLQLVFFINEAVKEICVDAQIQETEKAFNVVAGQSEYSLTDIDSRLITINKSGLYWYNGTNYKQLDPKTRKYLDEHYATWRNRTAGTPQSYFIEGDILTVFPTPDASISNGFKLSYIRRFLPMANDTDQPFHTESSQSTQINRYDVLSWSIIDKCLVFLNKVLQEQQAETLKEQLYRANLILRLKQIKIRPDINTTKYNVMGASYVPESY